MEPTPVLDTSDLDAILALDAPSPAERPVFTAENHDEYKAAQERYGWARWVTDAKLLAAAGVQPGPSHRVYKNRADSVARTFLSTWGVFEDYENLARPGSPLTMFGVEVEPNNLELPHLPEGYLWRAVAAQTAGFACHHRYIVGIVLDPLPERVGDLAELAVFADADGHDCIGVGGVTLSTAKSYAELLERFGLRAENTWGTLEEGCYPLDPECAPLLSATDVPGFDELYPKPSEDAPSEEKWRYLNTLFSPRWAVFVLGENCD